MATDNLAQAKARLSEIPDRVEADEEVVITRCGKAVAHLFPAVIPRKLATSGTGRLQEAGIRISMDGRGRYIDNIFIERLWRSLKYEAIYLHELASGAEARRVIRDWVDFYNNRRLHQVLNWKTLREVYRGEPETGDFEDRPCGTSGSSSEQAPRAQDHRPAVCEEGVNRRRNRSEEYTLKLLPGCSAN